MTEHDLPMLHEWLQRPHVLEWWGDQDARLPFEQMRAKYHPGVMSDAGVTPYIATLGGRPVGYAQSYVAFQCGDGWWEDETDPGVRGIDQFLADPDQLGKGFGPEVVNALVQMLFMNPEVTRIQADPHPANRRAIRCYEKAGFKAARAIVTPDGPALYMIRERATPA